MKIPALLLVSVFLHNLLFAQDSSTLADTTHSVYTNLKTYKFYSATYNTTMENGVTTYYINGEKRSKVYYDSYHSTWKNLGNCKPCILISYDINGKLLSKSIQYTDCPVGYSIKYHSNGKVKEIGHYKENATGDWNDLYARGYCLPDGTFTYFNEDGKKLYTEYWKDGKLISKVTE